MSISRVYQPCPLTANAVIVLDANATNHIARVLRANINDELTLFNGTGGEYSGTIIAIDKKTVKVQLGAFNPRSAESPLNLCLAQGISRGEKMDYTIQKAVELGVKTIIPLLTERCTVKLSDERRQKRFGHWQSIVISACEQSGRNEVPEILPPQALTTWITQVIAAQRFVLAPEGARNLRQFSIKESGEVVLLVGPEGGLSPAEIRCAEQNGFSALNLGPRILRTETAAVAALTALQCMFGDMVG